MSAKTALNNVPSPLLAALAVFLSGGLAAFVPVTHADVYSWTDEAGNPHFTDSAESVPKKYRHKVEIDDDTATRNWEYLASEYGVNYYYDASNVVYNNRNRYQVLTKESYAASGQEEYETMIIFDCARLLYKPLHSVRVFKLQRTPVETRNSGDDSSAGYRNGYQRLSYPYQVLSRIICRDSGK